MKKILLTILMSAAFYIAQAQIIVKVLEPANLVGTYAFTYGDIPGGWGSPDLNIPANAVQDTLAFVNDGSVGDSLGCNPLVNDSLISGKIAVVYRGSCEFGEKAFRAMNAGAVAVIIINNIGGAPVGMAPGTYGAQVTIPVVMISQSDGAVLRSEIEAGNVVAFIGSKAGVFADDLGFLKGDVQRARRFSNISMLSQNASEFNSRMGSWVRNYGNQNQTDALLNATVVFGSDTIYNQTSLPFSVNSGDSAYVSLPTFSQASYPVGYYSVKYTVTTLNPDGDNSDNSVNSDFAISESEYSYAATNPVTGKVIRSAHYRPSDVTGEFQNCVAFQDANAGRLKTTGMSFAVTSSNDTVLNDEYIQLRAYKWEDVFTDINDVTYDNLVSVGEIDYNFPGDFQDSLIYLSFPTPILLENDARYLFCFSTPSTIMYLGSNQSIDYNTAQDTIAQPSFPLFVDNSAYLNGFGTDIVPALSVRMESATGINEQSAASRIVPFPNPANDIINISVGNYTGTAQLEVFDITGKMVKSENVTIGKTSVLQLNISDINNGVYVFKLTANGETPKSFNVVISK
ncbi:MAG: T9SS type A sorting domain-containing protein [Bacteroidia bacterium]|nr:T9SS type A sorting domain-containing protein [Bacteroidia bacterium]MCZ2248031.1 T9SS type A sorting domain-containing protein [Bacteroidia bacterium]